MNLFKVMEYEPTTLVAAAVVVATMLLGFTRWLRRRLETKLPFPNQLPMVPAKSHWLLGHFQLILGADHSDLYRLCKEAANDHGQVSLWLGRRRGVYCFDLDDCHLVLNREQQRLRPALVQWHANKFVGPSGLLGLNGQQWRLHRAAVARTFNPEFLSAARKDMKLIAQRMVETFQQSIVKASSSSSKDMNGGIVQIDVEPAMKSITLDIFGKTSLDTDLGCTSSVGTVSPMVQAFEYILRQFMMRLQRPLLPQHILYWLPTEQNRRQHRERHLIRSFLANLLNQKRNIMNKCGDNSAEKDLLSHLLRSHAEIKKSGSLDADDVTDDSLIDVVMTNFVAGYDTTSIALGFALYLLAQNSQAQDECAREALQSKSGCEDPNELVYCKAVIWEALRLFPPAVRTNRTLKKPLKLKGGFVVPAGTEVWIPISDFHTNETYFPSPHSFRPDRWAVQPAKNGRWVDRCDDNNNDSTTSTIAAGNRKAMLAFSAGARNCVGYKFALQEATIVLANLVKDIEFRPVKGFKLTTSTKALLHKPDNGVPLLLSIRSK